MDGATSAYLLIRSGDGQRRFPLDATRPISIGRTKGNAIVLDDERVSRRHATLEFGEGNWVLRDLGSRNGTAVGSQLVTRDVVLEQGDEIRIGRSVLQFFAHLPEGASRSGATRAATRSQADPAGPQFEEEGDARSSSSTGMSNFWDSAEIQRRRGTTRYLVAPPRVGALSDDRVVRNAPHLCRLAYELGKADSLDRIAHLALEGIVGAVSVDAGALLLKKEKHESSAPEGGWEVAVARVPEGAEYLGMSPRLADSVAARSEAVLCSATSLDAAEAKPDAAAFSLSLGGQTRSSRMMLCAPVRVGERVLGLLHLYSTRAGVVFDADDLEYVLAVASTVAVAFDNLNRRDALQESLTKVQSANRQLRRQLHANYEIVGSGPAMDEVHRLIQRAAMSRATLLLRGESGVGKELVARAVHLASPRSEEPLVCLNCAALSEDLLASELFGHERGAFTGATDRKIGKFEAADRGTLVLDEIGEMSPAVQAKFLRVLEGHPFERVGGNESVRVDVRVVAATNRDLEEEVAQGRFRRDLFFRLRVLEIVVPPLRHRPDDIIELADHFLNRFREETGRKITGFTPDALNRLREYRWPGNVRELKNVVERAVLLCPGEQITPEDLLLSSLTTPGDTGRGRSAEASFNPCSLMDLERSHIEATLRYTKWNKSRAASILGIERSTLDRKIRRHGIQRGDDS